MLAVPCRAELESVRQYVYSQTRLYSHLLGNLVPLNVDKVSVRVLTSEV
jgi:hypothetical protein